MDTTTTLRLVPRRRQAGADTSTRTTGPTPPRSRSMDVTVRTDDRLLLSVEDAAQRLDIGRTMLYELISAGQITTIQIGRLRKVPVEALREYVDRQRAAAERSRVAHHDVG